MLYNLIRPWTVILTVLLMSATVLASGGDSTASSAKPEAANAAATNAPNAAPAAGLNPAGDPLVRLLVAKGVLSSGEANGLATGPASEMHDRLLLLLKDKGVLSADDLNSLKAAVPVPAANLATAAPSGNAAADLDAQRTGPPQTPPTPPPSGPIPAVAPIRVLQIDPPKREGVLPTISIGKATRVQPYGLFKASVIYDTSSPYGNDFPLPAFSPITNGPTTLPEFHVKARFFRIGSNFEWMDTPNLIVTGKAEADFEGNFSRVNNRNISAIRSNVFQLRLAYGRIDYHTTDKTSIFGLFGQDWTPFGNSTLPNLFETTGYQIGFGTLYERAPQFRFGLEHDFGGLKLGPEFAVVLPAYANLPADLTVQSGPLAGTPIANNEGLSNQLGYGERQGVDSSTPEIQARLVGQWQLDHAPGVAPAQVIVSGVHGTRTAVVLANQVPVLTNPPVGVLPTVFQTAFPKGTQVDSDRNAWTGEIQLPTRWFTLIGKYYNGSDLRFYFAGQIFGPFNDTTGLTSTATAQTIDGSSTLVFGLRTGVPVIAKSLPPRAQGGFVNLGLPLSRLANADPTGRNAGWVLYLHYGYDQVLARDVRRLGGGRMKGDVFAGTLQYKLNNFVTFVVEESVYRTRAIPLTATGLFPAFDGRPMRVWRDVRTEVGPIFTF
jgi:hypothetical protein